MVEIKLPDHLKRTKMTNTHTQTHAKVTHVRSAAGVTQGHGRRFGDSRYSTV